jgi:hypothetical protein
MSKAIQSNTQAGDVRFVAGEDLTGGEGLLVKLATVGGKAAVALPDAQTDVIPFVVTEGDASGALVTVRPLEAGRNVRLRISGDCAAGDVLVLADPATPGAAGKVVVLPEDAGSYRAVAVAEAAGVDGGTPLCRPVFAGVIVVEAEVPGGGA